jgi:hypothetical protein
MGLEASEKIEPYTDQAVPSRDFKLFEKPIKETLKILYLDLSFGLRNKHSSKEHVLCRFLNIIAMNAIRTSRYSSWAIRRSPARSVRGKT